MGHRGAHAHGPGVTETCTLAVSPVSSRCEGVVGVTAPGLSRGSICTGGASPDVGFHV